MDLHSYLEERRKLVEDALSLYLPGTDLRPGRLHEAVRYSMLAPGKRIRPILVLASAEAVGGRAEGVLHTARPPGCIHAFSLIHDDRPCTDNHDYPRGPLASPQG